MAGMVSLWLHSLLDWSVVVAVDVIKALAGRCVLVGNRRQLNAAGRLLLGFLWLG